MLFYFSGATATLIVMLCRSYPVKKELDEDGKMLSDWMDRHPFFAVLILLLMAAGWPIILATAISDMIDEGKEKQ
jgi:hypothetical protein